MKTYVIKLTTLVDGNITTLYHQKLELNTRKDVMNVYTPHSVSDKKKALKFYEKEEAERMAKFLHDEKFCQAEVI